MARVWTFEEEQQYWKQRRAARCLTCGEIYARHINAGEGHLFTDERTQEFAKFSAKAAASCPKEQ